MLKKNNDVRDPEATRRRTVNVNFQAVEVFCEVLRLQSFSRGAAVLGISQSAASQLVASLETQLGIRLIDRATRPLTPTPEGRAYYAGSREILHRHRALVDEIRRGDEAARGTVRVASIYSVGLHTLNLYLQQFMAANAGATVHLEYFHPARVYAAVLDEEADIGVISYPEIRRQIDVVSWLEEEMVVACPRDHALATRQSISLGEIDGQRFVAFVGDLRIRREIDRALKNIHASVEVVSEFDNIETIKQALEVSRAVSILPRPSIQREVELGTLVEVSIDERPFRPVGIISKRKRKMTRTTELFVEALLGRPLKLSTSETM